MTYRDCESALSLYDAARAMGVSFTDETIPQEKFVKANGIDFHYLEWGNKDNPPLLLLHGFAQTCHSWDFVALSLSDKFRVVALDQRGHGDTSWDIDGDYSPGKYQEDLRSVIDRLGLDNLILIGLSMGGRNAFTFAAENKSLVKSLIIVDAAPQNQKIGSENIRRFVQQEDELDSIEDFVARVMEYNPRRSPKQIRGSIRHNLKQLPSGKWTWKYDKVLRSGDAILNHNREYSDKLWSDADSVDVPTLIVRGSASDVISMETGEELHKRIIKSQLVTIEDAGHLVVGDNPSGFCEAVKGFLSDIN